MRKLIVVLVLAVATLLGVLTAPPAQAQEYPNVKGLTPFSPQANFMSLPGYLRWRYLLSSGRWITREQAVQIVKDQGAPTGPAM